MKGGEKITNPPRERLQPRRHQSVASPWALPPARAVPCPQVPEGSTETTARGGKGHAGQQEKGGRAASREAPGSSRVSPAPLATSPWSQPRHRRVPRSRSAAAARSDNPPAAPSRWPPPPPCCGGAGSGEDGDVPQPWHPQHPALSLGRGAGDTGGHRASGLGTCSAQGGHGWWLGAGDTHDQRIRGPVTAGWGPRFVRGSVLAASPGSWGSRCYVKANNAAVVPSLPRAGAGRAGELRMGQ